jgi:DNA repair protein RecO (recombination protein O)
VALEKTEALILRTIKFGETSRIVTALSRDFGLLKAIAKGVRGARPKFGAALDPFAASELVVYRKRERDLHLIGQADLLEAHLPLSGDLRRYAFASALAEFIPQVVSGEVGSDEAPALYAEAREALRLIAESVPATLPYILRAFQLRFISAMGHGMELHACLACGREVEGAGALSAAQGGLFCSDCASDGTGMVPVSAPALAVLRAYRENPLVVAARQRLESPVRAEVGRILEAFLSAQFDGYRGLRSLKLAAQVID